MKPNAKETCLELDSTLLVISSRHENQFFENLTLENNWTSFWLGINDGQNEGQWVRVVKNNFLINNFTVKIFLAKNYLVKKFSKKKYSRQTLSSQ